jgi:hypothetical protein
MPLVPALLPLLLVLAAPAFATPTSAVPMIFVSPIYSQLVAIDLPDPFQPGFENERGGSYILEFAPKGETVDAWSQLITITGVKGLAAQASVQDMAARLAQGYQTACPDSLSAKGLPPPKVKGAAAVFAGYLSCGSHDGQSETMVYLVLQGQQEIYTVQWATRGPAGAAAIPFDAEIWWPRLQAIARVKICNRVAGEVAPYPSCTE